MPAEKKKAMIVTKSGIVVAALYGEHWAVMAEEPENAVQLVEQALKAVASTHQAQKTTPRQVVSPQYPRKIEAIQAAPNWTTYTYREVCDFMRGRSRKVGYKAKRVIGALQAYFKHSALVVPTVPRTIRVDPTNLVLYRGVHYSALARRVPAVGSTVSSNAGCFTAFTFDPTVARQFVKDNGFVYRLEANRIARGTPWAWFTDRYRADVTDTALRNSLGSTIETEREVLLPPGYFKVLSVFRDAARFPGGVPVVDIAFVPNPMYVRRSVVPTLKNDGDSVVTRTVRGNRLVVSSANLAKKIRDRRSAIVASAAAVVTGRRMK